jgi:NAD(P)-dependent dehydrogenase (short-subunit alcohol dehydrogenase family)
LKNKIILITGTAEGIGKLTATDLAKMGEQLAYLKEAVIVT